MPEVRRHPFVRAGRNASCLAASNVQRGWPDDHKLSTTRGGRSACLQMQWLIGATIIAVCAICQGAHALTTPTPSKADSRVQTAPYNPSDVIALHMGVGRALSLQFPTGQVVTDVILSD